MEDRYPVKQSKIKAGFHERLRRHLAIYEHYVFDLFMDQVNNESCAWALPIGQLYKTLNCLSARLLTGDHCLSY